MRSVNDADEIHDAVQLGWQCGYAYAGYYPESSHEQQQRAAHSDAEQLVEQQEDRQHFVEAWMQGVRAALTIDQGEQIGMCPCCGQEDTFLTTSRVLFVGEFDEAGQVNLVARGLCPPCAALSLSEQFLCSLKRPAPLMTPPYKVLSLLVNEEHSTDEVAEAVANSFPCLTSTIMRTEGVIAILVEGLTPEQFCWTFSKYAYGYIDAVGLTSLYPARSAVRRIEAN